LDTALVQLERNGALHGVHAVVRSKKNLTPPTLSEMGMLRQLNSCFVIFELPTLPANLCPLSGGAEFARLADNLGEPVG